VRTVGTTFAVRIAITGVVQGVGFRPFVYRAAAQSGVHGWVLNGEDGVHIHAEGDPGSVERFIAMVRAEPPPAASVASFRVAPAESRGLWSFEIRDSRGDGAPTVHISPDLPMCDECRGELSNPGDRRFGYGYINCTNCGPRYSIVLGLPYDRERTTMRDWPLCAACSREYDDPTNRRFHAQPVACHACGPAYRLLHDGDVATGAAAIAGAAALLRAGAILAIKGIGGYHLACDPRNLTAVQALRDRKYRKERPFALMARDLAAARELVALNDESERLLTSSARPIVLAPAIAILPLVAPHNSELGVMLPYAPLHELLFAEGAPRLLVMTSANRSSEPIAYRDDDAFATLGGVADAFLVGERPIARRLDDSIARTGPLGPTILRRSRGLAPQAVASFPAGRPILALGADLKNALTLVVGGQAFAGQHVGDLQHHAAREAFSAAARDLCSMYDVDLDGCVVAHDLHPHYHSTEFGLSLAGPRVGVQHHRAHVASVLAERGAWDVPVVGFAFDGAGYGDDATIWGGEVFEGTLLGGLERVARLRPVPMPGGDAAARHPVQAAAGFLFDVVDPEALAQAPLDFDGRYRQACELIDKKVRVFMTSSVGRLFDTVAAIGGFTREQTFEGQAAMWLEHQARASGCVAPYAFALRDGEFDSRPVLRAAVADRLAGRPVPEIARSFHGAVADAVVAMAEGRYARRVVVSGGVFQNALLLELLWDALRDRLWTNRSVPPNDGGISLGQAAIATVAAGGTL
jgi:hydrogenase maturation protein HypF